MTETKHTPENTGTNIPPPAPSEFEDVLKAFTDENPDLLDSSNRGAEVEQIPAIQIVEEQGWQEPARTETTPKTPESWFFTVTLSEQARNFAEKLYHKVLASERLSGGTIEKKASEWAQRAEIWYHSSLEKAASANEQQHDKEITAERAKIQKHEQTVAAIDDDFARIRKIAEGGNFPISSETEEAFQKKRASAEAQKEHGESVIESIEFSKIAAQERKATYTEHRRETVEQLAGDDREIRHTNTVEILQRTEYLEKLKAAITKHQTAMRSAEETLIMAKEALNESRGTDEEIQEQVRKQLSEFVKMAEGRYEEAKKVYETAMESKTEFEKKIYELLNDTRQRQKKIDRFESKYLTEEERTSRTEQKKQQIDELIANGDWNGASRELTNRGDINALPELVARAISAHEQEFAKDIITYLPAELRVKTIEHAVNAGSVSPDDLTPLLEMIDDKARKDLEVKIKRQQQAQRRGRPTASATPSAERSADSPREKPTLTKRWAFENFVDEYNIKHPDETVGDLPMFGNSIKKYKSVSEAIPEIQEAFRLKTGKNITKKEVGSLLETALKAA